MLRNKVSKKIVKKVSVLLKNNAMKRVVACLLIIAMLLSVESISLIAGTSNSSNVTEVTVTDHTANGNKDHRYIYFTVNPAIQLSGRNWTAYKCPVISINGGEVRSDIPIRNALNGGYVVDFYGTDLEKVSKEGMTVKLEGDLTDGEQTLRLAATKFTYNSTEGKWELDKTPDVTEVTIADHASNGGGNDKYIYFTVNPAIQLAGKNWTAYKCPVISVNGGEVRSDIPIRNVLNGGYVVDLYGTDLESVSKEGMTVKLEGDLTDGEQTIRMTATEFKYNSTSGKWEVQEPSQEPDVKQVTIADHASNNGGNDKYVYFTVTPETTLATTGWKAYYGSVISVNGGTIRSDIPIRSVGSGGYVVDLYGTDLESVSKEGMTIKLEGDLTDGEQIIRMTATEFKYNSTVGKWEINNLPNVTEVAIADHASNGGGNDKYIYFTVNPAIQLAGKNWTAYKCPVISVNGGVVRSDIPIRNVLNGGYVVDLYGTDLESVSKEGMTIKLEGDLTDGEQIIRMAATEFKYNSTAGKWELYVPSEEPDITEVTIADHTSNGNKDHRYIYFTVNPAIQLAGKNWTAYKCPVISVNGGAVRSDIPIRNVLNGGYVVDLYGTDLESVSKEGMTIKLEGDLTDGEQIIRMAATEFKYNSTAGKWELYVPSEEPDITEVTIADHSSNGNKNDKYIYFTVTPETTLKTTGWKAYYGSVISVNDEAVRSDIPIRSVGVGVYVVDLYGTDLENVSKDGMTIKIEGDLTDGEQIMRMASTSFVNRNNKWVLASSVENQELQPARVQTLDIYEITHLSSVTVPGKGKNYNLGSTGQTSNIELAMQIDKLQEPIVFGLSKTVANNVWVESGYLIEINPSGGFVKILSGSGVGKATLTGQDFSKSFELTYGVVDMYPKDGGTQAVARRIYVKKDGVEILSWLDWEMSQELGTYVPIWSQASEVLNSVNYKGYKLQSTTPTIQDVSELIDGVRSFTTTPKREVMVGTTAAATNQGVLMKVKWHENKAISKEGDELLFSFGNSSTAGIWMKEDGGYNILFTKGLIRVRHCNDGKIVESVSYTLPNDEFLLEIGTYDRAVYKDNAKQKDHSRVVYVKIDGNEIISFVDTDINRKIGKNLWVYSTENVVADLISLTSERYFIEEQVVVSDLYDVTAVSRKTLNKGSEMYLGDMKNDTNVAFRTKVKVSKDCPELYFGLSKSDKRLWDADESGWQFWIKPKTQQLFLVYKGSTVGSLRAYNIPEEFVLEIGVREVRYNDGERFGREIYINIDGEEALTYMDKDFSRKLGKHVCAYSSKGFDVVLESLTTTGYIPTEKNIQATDIFDASGYASIMLSDGLNYLGQINAEKNSAIKMRVRTSKETEEFGISLGKAVDHTITEDVTDASVSGWNLWFRPKYNSIAIQYGYYKTATTFSHDFSENFVLEVGSRDVYYENGKYYGYEVYVKIDGVTIGSWLDEDVKKRTVGTNVMASLSVDSDVILETLYNTITLPVEYVVNGNVQDKVEHVRAETTVVEGKPSKITVVTEINAECKMYNRGVKLNEEVLVALDDKKAPVGKSVYEISAKKGDNIIIDLERRELTVDEPSSVLDMYAISNMQSLNVPGMSAGSLGSMMDGSDRARTNSALRFKVTMPQNGGSVRWGMYSDQSSSWGWNGFIAGLSNGRATLYSVTYNQLATGNVKLVSPGQTIYVECGMVKCFEDGNYKYNRFYIKVGETLDELEQVCWYDSRERGGYGTTVSFIGMDAAADYTIHSTATTYTITDISEQADKDRLNTYQVYKETKIAAYYPERVVSYEKITDNNKPAEIKIHPQEGKVLETLKVNGKDVTQQVNQLEDGSYSYQLPSVTGDVKFSYIIK